MTKIIKWKLYFLLLSPSSVISLLLPFLWYSSIIFFFIVLNKSCRWENSFKWYGTFTQIALVLISNSSWKTATFILRETWFPCKIRNRITRDEIRHPNETKYIEIILNLNSSFVADRKAIRFGIDKKYTHTHTFMKNKKNERINIFII